MKDKTKKWLVIGGLAVVCAGLVFGISRVLYREPVSEVQFVDQEADDTEVTVEIDKTDTLQTDNGGESTEESLMIETGSHTAVDEKEQAIQKEPEKTENEKPKEAPALSGEADVENPETTPAYEEQQGKESQPSGGNGSPATGDTKDGMVYVEGFGWIPDEGEGSGTYAGDMYENGNKIGIMD